LVVPDDTERVAVVGELPVMAAVIPLFKAMIAELAFAYEYVVVVVVVGLVEFEHAVKVTIKARAINSRENDRSMLNLFIFPPQLFSK
jgi:hypothetical protein